MGIFDLFEKPKVKKEFYENGKLKNEATYKSGKQNGPEKGYHENGNLHYECEWINGEQDGEITSYDEDGNKKKQSFLKKGSYDGPQKEWWPNGKLRADRIMKNNEIISEETYSQNGTVVVFEDKIEDIGIVSHYNGKPFTGIMFVDPYAPAKNFAVKYWWVNEQYEMVDGLKDGLKSEFYENGKIKMQTKFSKDEFINIIGHFDPKGNNLIETKTCLTYDMLEEKNDIYYHGGKPYNGSIIYSGGSISVFADGIKVSSKHYFLDGTIKTISEIVDSDLVELKGWIKVDEEGNYDENGKKILVREYKDGRKLEYYKTGNIKSESDVVRRKTDSDSNNTFVEIKYFENGNIQCKEVKTKYDADGNNGGVTVEYKLYYESGELRREKVEDEKFITKYIGYHEDKTIQSISVSNTQYEHEGHTFAFDEKGNEITIRYEEQLSEEESIRKYLNLGKFKGVLKSKPKEREILTHEIMTKGGFMLESDEGKTIDIFGQRHTLVTEIQIWNEESEEWEEGDREESDDFYLTEYEKGYRFSEDDIMNHFNLDEWPEWDYNGFSNDWCGIEDDDDNETRQKKWDDYKSKFPKLTSKEQFDVTS